MIFGEFQSLLQEYLKYKNSIEYYEKTALPQAELIIEQSGKSYKSGDIDYVEYVLNLDKALEIKSSIAFGLRKTSNVQKPKPLRK